MQRNISPYFKAVLQALLVTFLWSTSWVLIKIGLPDIPALPFAGLRYLLAFFALLPFAIRSGAIGALRKAGARSWGLLLVLGLVYYSITQGTQFLSLLYLPAATISLMLSLSAILVAFLGIGLLREQPSVLQWLGSGVYVVGVLIYFLPVSLTGSQITGLIIAGISMLANAFAAILGRYVNRSRLLEPLTVTTASMGVGALVLMITGVIVQGMPALSVTNWLLVLWLAVINSAFAFNLWNRTLQTLPAMESSIINNTMLIQIAILAWVFLGESLTAREITGLALAAIGTLVVQLRSPAGKVAQTAAPKTSTETP